MPVLSLPLGENVTVWISSFCSLTSLSSKSWPVLSVFNFWACKMKSTGCTPCETATWNNNRQPSVRLLSLSLCRQEAEELNCLIWVMKPFSDVWYKPLPWCQFHFGNLQMFWWVPVCRFNIPPMPEPSSPVIIVTTCVLVRNARRWFWCNRGVGFFFLLVFFLTWREQSSWNWGSSNESLFYLCSGRHVLLNLAIKCCC